MISWFPKRSHCFMGPHSRMPKKKRPKKSKLTARTADRHALYQESVQDTESEVTFLTRMYKKLRGRPALSLREDFCGTALLCAEWIKKKGRTAGASRAAQAFSTIQDVNAKSAVTGLSAGQHY